MIKLRNVISKDIESIIDLVKLNGNVLQSNNFMIYYLCCTVFENYSFIAFQKEKPVGFLFAFPDSKQAFIWVHQMAVEPQQKRKGIGSKLLKKLEAKIEKSESPCKRIRLAVKHENHQAKSMYIKHGFKLLKMDDLIKMEIYEKTLFTTPNKK